MRELLVIHTAGGNYGIWKDEIQSVRSVETLHRLPLSPACIAGMSVIDGRTATLADLSASIGCAPCDGSGKCSALILPGDGKMRGFLAAGDIDSLQVPPEDVIPLPGCVSTDAIHSCSNCGGVPVPVIDLQKLFSHLMKFEIPPSPSFSVPRSDTADVSASSGIRIFSLGDEIYALSSSGVGDEALSDMRTAGIPFSPAFLKGIAFHEGEVLPVVDLSMLINRQKTEDRGAVLIQRIGDARFALLVGEDRGAVRTERGMIASLPPIARSSWLQYAVLQAGHIVPLIDSSLLLSADDEVEKCRKTMYAPESLFADQFGKKDVEVVEFSLLGSRHALPKCEVEDVIDFKPYRSIPNTAPIVVGTAEFGGGLLPVLDLALVFGRRSPVTPDWRMMLVKNGDFRSFVLTEAVSGQRRLPVADQRELPIRLPHRVVYGCYPDADTVRLILNVEALAVHFEKSLVQELLPAMPKEMKHAAAEIVLSLLGDFAAAEPGSDAVMSQTPAVPAAVPTASVSGGTTGTMQKANVPTGGSSVPVQEQTGERPEEKIAQEAGEGKAGAPAYQSAEAEKSGDPGQSISGSEASAKTEAAPPEGRAAGGGERKEEETVLSRKEPSAVAEPTEEAVRAEVAHREQEVPAIAGAEEAAGAERIGSEQGSVAGRHEEVSISLIKEEELTTEALPESQPGREPEPPRPEKPPFPEFRTPRIGEPASETAKPAIDRHEKREQQVPASKTLEYMPSGGKTWKWGIGLGAAAVVLAGILYGIGVSYKSGAGKPVKEQTPPTVEHVQPESKAQPVRRREPLVLEIPAAKPVTMDVYVVVKGDTLWGISERFTGNPFNYPRIAGENKIADPDLIFPGQKVYLRHKQNATTKPE